MPAADEQVKRRSRGRHRVLSLVLVTLIIMSAMVLGEVIATGYYFMRDGQYISPRDRLAAEKNAYVEGIWTKDCMYGDSLLVHPFLANVQSSKGPCGASYANSHSLIGKEFPDNPHFKTAYILVTGGSVAAQFTWDNRQQESALERILNEQFVGDQYDRFIVLNGGHGAWKQPNQYILFGLYANVLAGVITLDGFNEHYMIGGNQRFELPSNNFFDVVKRLDPRGSLLSDAALKLEASLYRLAREHWLVQHSAAAYLAIDGVRSWLRNYASGAGTRTAHRDTDWVNATYEKMFVLTEDMEEDERARWALDEYAKYIRLMHAGATALGIKTLFLIQPTPAFDKPLTQEEQNFVRMTNKDVYERMSRHLLRLKERSGIPVYSLGDVFQGTKDEVYQDAIHVNQLGNRLMAERIADMVEREWKWPRHRPHESMQ